MIENRGKAPMPVPLVVTRTDGQHGQLTVPVDVWLGGAKRTTVKVAKGSRRSRASRSTRGTTFRTWTGTIRVAER